MAKKKWTPAETKKALHRITPRTRMALEKLRLGFQVRVQVTGDRIFFHLVKGTKHIRIHHGTVAALQDRGLIVFDRVESRLKCLNKFYSLRPEFRR